VQGAAAGAGLAICYAGPKSYCLLRVLPGKAQLVRVTDQGQEVLAEQPLSGGTRKHTLRVSFEDGLVTGHVDDTVRLQALAPDATGGAIALYADGKASFDSVRLSLLSERRGSHVTKEFAITDKHPEMAAWASDKSSWVTPPEGKDDWWTKGDYFGDTAVAFTVPAVGSKTGTARATLGTDPDQKAGLELDVATTEKSKQLSLAILVGGKELKKTALEVEGDAHIVFSRESKLVVVRVNDQAVLSVTR